MLGHVPQLGKALQPLKHQLNLPTHTVKSQNVRRRTTGARRKHDDVLSKFECSRPSDHLLLTRFAQPTPMSLLNRAVALSYCTQSACKRRTLTMKDNPPFTRCQTGGFSILFNKCGRHCAHIAQPFAEGCISSTLSLYEAPLPSTIQSTCGAAPLSRYPRTNS